MSWNQQDSGNLRNFLATDTGKNLIEEYKNSRPESIGDTLEAKAITGAHLEQWHQDAQLIKRLRDWKETDNSGVDRPMLDLRKY